MLRAMLVRETRVGAFTGIALLTVTRMACVLKPVALRTSPSSAVLAAAGVVSTYTFPVKLIVLSTERRHLTVAVPTWLAVGQLPVPVKVVSVHFVVAAAWLSWRP